MNPILLTLTVLLWRISLMSTHLFQEGIWPPGLHDLFHKSLCCKSSFCWTETTLFYRNDTFTHQQIINLENLKNIFTIADWAQVFSHRMQIRHCEKPHVYILDQRLFSPQLSIKGGGSSTRSRERGWRKGGGEDGDEQEQKS